MAASPVAAGPYSNSPLTLTCGSPSSHYQRASPAVAFPWLPAKSVATCPEVLQLRSASPRHALVPSQAKLDQPWSPLFHLVHKVLLLFLFVMFIVSSLARLCYPTCDYKDSNPWYHENSFLSILELVLEGRYKSVSSCLRRTLHSAWNPLYAHNTNHEFHSENKPLSACWSSFCWISCSFSFSCLANRSRYSHCL